MARKFMVPALAVLAFAIAAPAFAQVPANIAKAVADPSRPAAETARDAARRPGEIDLSLSEAAVEKHVARALEQLRREVARAERRAGGGRS